MGLKLMLVQQFNIITKEEEGSVFVAVDTVGAGEGEVVMLVRVVPQDKLLIRKINRWMLQLSALLIP